MTEIPIKTDAKLTNRLHTVLNWLRQTNCLLQNSTRHP